MAPAGALVVIPERVRYVSSPPLLRPRRPKSASASERWSHGIDEPRVPEAPTTSPISSDQLWRQHHVRKRHFRFREAASDETPPNGARQQVERKQIGRQSEWSPRAFFAAIGRRRFFSPWQDNNRSARRPVADRQTLFFQPRVFFLPG